MGLEDCSRTAMSVDPLAASASAVLARAVVDTVFVEAGSGLDTAATLAISDSARVSVMAAAVALDSFGHSVVSAPHAQGRTDLGLASWG